MRIQTEKGWLEALTASHAHELFDLIHMSRGHLHRWLPWLRHIHSPEDTEAFVLRFLAERGPQFVINVEGQICGGVGFHLLDQRLKFASIGYWLGSEFIGQGIMGDAVIHLCRYGFNELGLENIEIRCAVQNLDSRRIPERLGFCLEGVEARAEWVSDRYVDHAVYTILRAEFNVLHPQTLSANDASVIAARSG